METASNPGLSIAFALAAGVIGQSLARHLRLPGIVVLLGLGVALGPDYLGAIHPESLGASLQTLVGFAVAVILFEGGMNLDLRRLRQARLPVRRLVTLGAAITAVGGMLIARLCMEWEWRTSVLFGTLVIVTGPTVINPLLRRIKVERSVATVLEAEGILGDAIGAITAAVALEIAVRPSGSSVALGPIAILARLGFGFGFGSLIGFALAWLLRRRRAVPEGMENIFILSLALALFQGANALMHESGIPAVTAAGVVIGNCKGIHVQRDLLEFKEQLTVMLIGLLFILLAADVRVADVAALGTRGAVAVGLLLLVLRPATVFGSTWGGELTTKQKLFMSWIGPRGIVAAAVASLFAANLAQHDYAGGRELRALVFLVIAISVLSAGLTGGLVAHLLGVRRRAAGWLVLGANELARAHALLLKRWGEEVTCIDSNGDFCRAAQEAGLHVHQGNGLEESTLLRAGVEDRLGALGMTANDEVNYLFVKHVKEIAKLERLIAATGDAGNTVDLLRNTGGELLTGQTCDVEVWCVRLRRQIAAIERWRMHERPEDTVEDFEPVPQSLALFLAVERDRGLVVERDRGLVPVTETTRWRDGDIAHVLVHMERYPEVEAWLIQRGWQCIEQRPPAQ